MLSIGLMFQIEALAKCSADINYLFFLNTWWIYGFSRWAAGPSTVSGNCLLIKSNKLNFGWNIAKSYETLRCGGFSLLSLVDRKRFANITSDKIALKFSILDKAYYVFEGHLIADLFEASRVYCPAKKKVHNELYFVVF